MKDPPDRALDIDDKGQYNPPEGERLSGSISFYDRATGALVAHVGKYIHFDSNLIRGDLPHSKHRIVWQPKFLPDARTLADRLPAGDVDPAALLGALEEPLDGATRACRILELAGRREPERTLLDQCAASLSGGPAHGEFWLVSDDEETAAKHYEAFHGADAAMRFECLDPAADNLDALDSGLLRPGAAEVLFLHHDADPLDPSRWPFHRRLLVPGGLALISHAEADPIGPPAGWTVVRAGAHTTLLQAPGSSAAPAHPPAIPGPRWVLGEPESLAPDWLARLDGTEAHPLSLESLLDGEPPAVADWPGVADLKAVDLFCGRDAARPHRSGGGVGPDRARPGARAAPPPGMRSPDAASPS